MKKMLGSFEDELLDDPGGLEDWEKDLEEQVEEVVVERKNKKRKVETTKQEVKDFKCADCAFSCKKKSDLVTHISIKHNETETDCPICGIKCKELSGHMRQMHEVEEDSTEEDDEGSKTGRKERKKTEKMAKCPHCLREFTNLKHHINQQHSQLKNFKCGDCGYRCYLKTDLERHITNVHDKCRTPCPICGKKYSDLRQHIRLVHEGHKLECPECGKKYTNLSQHLNKMHRKRKILMCDQCGKSFFLQSQLKRHEEDIHSFIK